MKTVLKFLADLLARLVVLPAVVLYWLGAALGGKERALRFWSEFLAPLAGTGGVYLRRAFYRYVLPECGPGCWIGFGVLIHSPNTRIGKNVYIGPYCSLGEVQLEDDVLLSTGVSVINGPRQHGLDQLDVPIRQQPGQWQLVRIGQNSWIGERAVVMADVGSHCVIGAGAVVTRPIPDYAVAVGVPARVIRYRNQPASPCPETGSSPHGQTTPGQTPL
ncbi:MAG: acyltransferase [Thermoguttaceae bacterium]|nr:acyltransferase [Thermoguttaceae bacterium]